MSEAETIADLRRELDDVRTANVALRVELHVTQQNLAAQAAATASLARGVQASKQIDLVTQAQLGAALAQARAELTDERRVAGLLRETCAAQREELSTLKRLLGRPG